MTKRMNLTLLIILLPIIIIIASTDSVIFNKQAYLKYESDIENKEEIITNLLDYFKNNKELIEQEGFTQEEKLHFLDVKNIIRVLNSILLFTLILTSMLLIKLFTETKKNKLRKLFSSYLIIGSSITIPIVLIIFLLSLNFNNSFNLFHSVLFKAGTWTFSATSLSIQLFPIELFQRFTKLILTRITFVSFILLTIGVAYKKH
ncbi:DUF1461 domain-containing protein [Candidatus Woesearchaeota archaeon]|nr:DUF1461 domain-containing protein [Candidatus Woesearchaeota archaeon]